MPETHLEFSVPLRTYPDSQSHVLILPSAAQQLRLVRSCASFCPWDCTAAAHKDCTAAAVAAGARPMNFPRTAHRLEAKEQSSAEPLLPPGQRDSTPTPCPMPLELYHGACISRRAQYYLNRARRRIARSL